MSAPAPNTSHWGWEDQEKVTYSFFSCPTPTVNLCSCHLLWKTKHLWVCLFVVIAMFSPFDTIVKIHFAVCSWMEKKTPNKSTETYPAWSSMEGCRGGVTAPQDNAGGRLLSKVSGPTPCPKHGQLWNQTRLLRAFSTWFRPPCKDWAGTSRRTDAYSPEANYS